MNIQKVRHPPTGQSEKWGTKNALTHFIFPFDYFCDGLYFHKNEEEIIHHAVRSTALRRLVWLI